MSLMKKKGEASLLPKSFSSFTTLSPYTKYSFTPICKFVDLCISVDDRRSTNFITRRMRSNTNLNS